MIANATPGPDGLYRTRVPRTVVRQYLEAARRIDALLILDVQPGHSDFLTELRPYEEFLREPDVGVALDREGLAVTIHADGFGGRQIKRRTYDELAADPPLFNGFKLFYEQDTNLFAPADVLGFSPTPDYVSYQ